MVMPICCRRAASEGERYVASVAKVGATSDWVAPDVINVSSSRSLAGCALDCRKVDEANQPASEGCQRPAIIPGGLAPGLASPPLDDTGLEKSL